MGIRDAFRKWNEYRRTIRELNDLDNRCLSDLGIDRQEIRAVAREHVKSL